MNPTWLLVEVTGILTLALIATRLARRSRAAVRHVILAAAFAVLLILPVASMIAPSVRIEVSPAVHAVIAPLDDAAVVNAVQPTGGTGTPRSTETSPVTPGRTNWSWPSLATLLISAWIAGAALCLLPFVVGLWQVRRLRRSGLSWTAGDATATTLADHAGIHRRIHVLLHASVPGPMTCGIVSPAIVLPIDAQTWAQ